MSTGITLEFQLYLITSTATEKQYVGQTRQRLNYRWNHHRHMAKTGKSGSCSALHAAMRKYGLETFSIAVIGVFSSQEEINLAEAAEIAARNTQAPNGYNLKAGGNASGHSQETIAKMRAAALLRVSRPAGFKHSEETKAKIGAGNRGKQTALGRVLSPSVKAKISFSNISALKYGH